MTLNTLTAIIIAQLLLICPFAHAELSEMQCSTVRLDLNGGSMDGIPLRKQETGICYAHATVDLIDARMGWQHTPSSPLDAAAHFSADLPTSLQDAFGHYWSGSTHYIEYAQRAWQTALGKQDSEWSGGTILHLFEHLKKVGVCPESKSFPETGLMKKVDWLGYDHTPNGMYRKKLMEFWDKYQRKPEAAIADEIRNYIIKSEELKVNTMEKEMRLHSPLRIQVESAEQSLKKTQQQLAETQRIIEEAKEGVSAEDQSRARELLTVLQIREKAEKSALDLSKTSFALGRSTCQYSPEDKINSDIALLFGDLEKIKNALAEEDIRKFYSKIFSLGCVERKKLDPKLLAIEETIQSEKDLEVRVTKSFDSTSEPKQPFSIGYCSEILFKGSLYRGGLVGSMLTNSRYPSKNCLAHASVVVGRRFNSEKKQCEVLVKNSWEIKNGKFGILGVRYHTDFEEEAGKVWIPLKALSHVTINATHLE